jgi:superfamily II DNA/RNA helicase
MGFSVTQIHGGMKIDDRITAEKEFWHKVQILVATEAAGEGINLQCCHLMVNYDIPWNPKDDKERKELLHAGRSS